jgi:hypothetical protein
MREKAKDIVAATMMEFAEKMSSESFINTLAPT